MTAAPSRAARPVAAARRPQQTALPDFSSIRGADAAAGAGYLRFASRAGSTFAAQSAYLVTGLGALRAMPIHGEVGSGFVRVALAPIVTGAKPTRPRVISALPATGHVPERND